MRMRPLIPRLEILARLLMSGFGSLADIRTAKSHVRFTPQEEISETRYLSFTATSFNRLTPPVRPRSPTPSKRRLLLGRDADSTEI
jgi:hypothetical protein